MQYMYAKTITKTAVIGDLWSGSISAEQSSNKGWRITEGWSETFLANFTGIRYLIFWHVISYSLKQALPIIQETFAQTHSSFVLKIVQLTQYKVHLETRNTFLIPRLIQYLHHFNFMYVHWTFQYQVSESETENTELRIISHSRLYRLLLPITKLKLSSISRTTILLMLKHIHMETSPTDQTTKFSPNTQFFCPEDRPVDSVQSSPRDPEYLPHPKTERSAGCRERQGTCTRYQ